MIYVQLSEEQIRAALSRFIREMYVLEVTGTAPSSIGPDGSGYSTIENVFVCCLPASGRAKAASKEIA
jgi:hypothetical protein